MPQSTSLRTKIDLCFGHSTSTGTFFLRIFCCCCFHLFSFPLFLFPCVFFFICFCFLFCFCFHFFILFLFPLAFATGLFSWLWEKKYIRERINPFSVGARQGGGRRVTEACGVVHGAGLAADDDEVQWRCCRWVFRHFYDGGHGRNIANFALHVSSCSFVHRWDMYTWEEYELHRVYIMLCQGAVNSLVIKRCDFPQVGRSGVAAASTGRTCLWDIGLLQVEIPFKCKFPDS